MDRIVQKPVLVALLGIILRSVLIGLVMNLAGFGLLLTLVAFSVRSDSGLSTVAKVMNAPGFLAAWFSQTGSELQAAVLMFAVNWACWSLLCAPIAVLVAVIRRRKARKTTEPG